MITILAVILISVIIITLFKKSNSSDNFILDDPHTIVEQETTAKIGLAFEKACTELFDKRYYVLEDWRGDKYHNGVYAKSSSLPDIVYTHKKSKTRFSIECKYRSKANKWIKLGEEYNIANYKKYSLEHQIPVFILLGVSGTPKAPGELYVIPLQNIDSNLVPYYKLKRYRKSNFNKGFYYDESTQVLK